MGVGGKKTEKPKATPSTNNNDTPKPEGIVLGSIGLVMNNNINIQIPEINIPTPPEKSFNDNSIDTGKLEAGNPININVGFKKDSGYLDVDNASGQKVLQDLVKTLVEYPQIQIIILGNASYSLEKYNKIKAAGNLKMIDNLQLSRANAIKDFLISHGVDVKRLSVGNGVIQSGSTSASVQANKK